MAYEATLIAQNKTFGTISTKRLSSNAWMIYRVDHDTGGAPGTILRSLDNGKTWATLYGAPGGSNFVDFLVDHLDRLYVCVEKNAGNKPTIWFFDENHAVSPQFVKWYEFTTWTDAINPRFAIDTYHKVVTGAGAGYPRFYVAYAKTGSNNVYWADTEGHKDLRIDTIGGSSPGNGNPQYRPSWAVAPGGIAYVAWIESGTQDSVYVKQRIEGTATLSARIKMSELASCQSIEYVAINPRTSLPAVLFRDAGSKLYISELNSDASVSLERVWDGTNDYNHSTGQRAILYFDARGARVVLAHPDVSGGKPRRVIYRQIVPLGHTGWFQTIVDGVAGKDTIAGAALGDWGQSRQGLKASTMAQGAAALCWLLNDGEANTEADLYLVFTDRQPGTGVYPGIEQSTTGELPPRREDVLEQLPSLVLTGEGTPATSYPLTPDHAYSDPTVRPTNLIRYEIGQIGGRPKFSDGRRVIVIRHNALTRAEWTTLDTFIKARYDDLALFNFTRPDKAGVPALKVFPIQKTWKWRRVGPDVFECEHRVLESP